MTMPEPHLDDDTFSALLDGDAAGEAVDHGARAHLAGCDRCAARLDVLGRARALVGTPVTPLPAAAVDDLVTRAVGPLPVVDIAAARDKRQRRWWAAPAPALVGAVAAVLVLLLAVPMLLSGGRDRDDSALASRSAADAESAGGGADAAKSGASAVDSEAVSGGVAAAPVAAAGEYLGPVATTDELRRILVARLSTRTTNYRDESGGPATAPASATGAVAALPCLDTARGVGGDRVGALAFAAFAQWKGEMAQVFVFQLVEPAPDGDRQAYVMRTSGCAVLGELRF